MCIATVNTELELIVNRHARFHSKKGIIEMFRAMLHSNAYEWQAAIAHVVTARTLVLSANIC
jgi:hypothetical protein